MRLYHLLDLQHFAIEQTSNIEGETHRPELAAHSRFSSDVLSSLSIELANALPQ